MIRPLAVVTASILLSFGAVPGLGLFQGAAQAQTVSAEQTGIREMVLGNEDAAVTVTEYASFTCIHCKNFHDGPFKQLKAEYIDTGRIKFIYREVYFDPPGLWASLVARCGGAERFFGISDLLYGDQETWSRAGTPDAIGAALRRIGRLAGLDNDQLEACMQDRDKAQALVAWYQENATADGIRSTPSFVVNGETYSNMSYSDLRDIIDKALESGS